MEGVIMVCDECGHAVPEDGESMIDHHHGLDCSLHPDNTANDPAEGVDRQEL